MYISAESQHGAWSKGANCRIHLSEGVKSDRRWRKFQEKLGAKVYDRNTRKSEHNTQELSIAEIRKYTKEASASDPLHHKSNLNS